ncbi:MAG: recombinase RecA [Candidatus Spechtbacterales bacterium]|nr:recombinase RecA [Candidatus Spechtbacterales bacterium]
MATKSKKKKKESKDKKEDNALDAVIDDIKKKFGEGSIMQMDPRKKTEIGRISTGSISLNIALGGGVPRSRITEVYGPESSGKTTLTLHVIAEAQKKGGLCAFVDAEHALDPEYAKRIGVKMKDLLISQPDSGEQALDIVESLVRSGSLDLIVIDSVAALTPQAEIEGEMGDQQMGLQARLMSKAMRKLTAIAQKSDTAIIFINQTRMKIGVMFGNPMTTTGGNALKFYSSVRIEVRQSAKIKSGEEIIGNRVKAKVVKNKTAPPFRTAEFDIFYNEGISYLSDLLNTGVKYEIVERAGAWYSYGEEKLGQGLDASREFLKDNKKVANAIEKEILKKTQA